MIQRLAAVGLGVAFLTHASSYLSGVEGAPLLYLFPILYCLHVLALALGALVMIKLYQARSLRLDVTDGMTPAATTGGVLLLLNLTFLVVTAGAAIASDEIAGTVYELRLQLRLFSGAHLVILYLWWRSLRSEWAQS